MLTLRRPGTNSKLSPAHSTIDHYVKSIVGIYDRNKRFEKWFGIIFLATGLVVPFAFVPQKLDRMSVSGALLDTGIMISITLILYIAAFRFGTFKNPHKEKLERDLAEWNELKALADEMKG